MKEIEMRDAIKVEVLSLKDFNKKYGHHNMKDKILEQFDKALDEQCFRGSNPYFPNWEGIKDFISQALDEYADWKIKECLKEIDKALDKRRFEVDYLVGLNYANGVTSSVLNDSLTNKDKIK